MEETPPASPDSPAWLRWGAAIVAGGYWLALTVGTHWPRLALPVVELVAWDKVLHFTAFAGLAVLIAFAVSRWQKLSLGGYVLLAVVLVAYGVVDELTQQLVGRSCELLDWLADATGIAMGLALFGLLSWIGERQADDVK